MTPVLLARDFAGQIGAMLRPPGKQWFWHRTQHESLNNDRTTRDYLDWRSSHMMRIMTDRPTGFHRATKIADEFFGFFGDAVMCVDVGKMQDSLRIHSYHIKDCTWALGDDGRANLITRKEKISLRNLATRFGRKNLHPKHREALDKDGEQGSLPV